MIPSQLKDCSFNRVLKQTKKPFEKDWTNKPYTYTQINQYFPQENYGVMTGINGLGVLDDDSEEKTLIKTFENQFKESFMVRAHYYINLEGWDGKKIIFYDKGKHLGELQGLGQMVVGAGSMHPSGEIYELKKDIPIKTILFEEFKECFKEFIPKIKAKHIYTGKTEWSGENISEITISSIISLSPLADVGGGCYQGSHPEHGSSGGMNFRVDTNNNVWYCFRCGSGGGPSELIGVIEGVINCSDAGPSCYSQDQAREVINYARDNYGLSTPEITEVKGWANSVSILKLAEKYNLKNCPKCNDPFEFKNFFGVFYCNTCKTGGNLTKFAKIISDNG